MLKKNEKKRTTYLLRFLIKEDAADAVVQKHANLSTRVQKKQPTHFRHHRPLLLLLHSNRREDAHESEGEDAEETMTT